MTDVFSKAGQEGLPRHIAIIMDGNGRWARRRGLPRSAGHVAGAETYRRIATFLSEIGVEYFTVYAFSTENWKRAEAEVSAIMGLLEKYLREAVAEMEKKRIKLRVFGNTDVLSPKIRELIAETEAISTRYEGIQANLCINYGGRDEIVRAAKRWAADPDGGELTEERLSGYLYSAGVPDPDLLIRPGGEYRLSNFLLWQCAYSEFYFTDTLWPDFDEAEIMKAIEAYRSRERRYGNAR